MYHETMQTVVITGASRGIGLATAQQFLNTGWRVIGTSLAGPVRLDLRSPQSIELAVGAIRKQIDHIDALVNNAAVLHDYHDETADLAHIRQTFEVNLFGTIAFTELIVPMMTRGGHIVNIDSSLGSFSDEIEEPGMLGYRMSKAGLNMYTRALAFRLRDRGILVSSLDPGWTNTDMGRVGGGVPPQEPQEPAADIVTLVTTVTDINETGHFWRAGKHRPW